MEDTTNTPDADISANTETVAEPANSTSGALGAIADFVATEGAKTTIDENTTGENVLVEAEKQPDTVVETPVVVVDETLPVVVKPILDLEAGVPSTDPVQQGPTPEQFAAREADFPLDKYPDDWYWSFNGSTNSVDLVRLYQPGPGADGSQLPRGIGFNTAVGGGFAALGHLNQGVILRRAFDDKSHYNKACLVINAAQAGEPMDKWQAVLTNRLIAETNPGTLQIIPYIVLMNEDDDILAYIRGEAGGESRLHGKLSIGTGGHIDSGITTTFEDLIVDETAREVIEETGFTGENLKERIRTALKGAIRLQSTATPVDAVHLGLGILLRVRTSELTKFEEGVLTNVQWFKPAALQVIANEEPAVVSEEEAAVAVQYKMEIWSKIMIGYITQILQAQAILKPV